MNLQTKPHHRSFDKNKICINCNKRGHFSRECIKPIKSCGMILCNVVSEHERKYLLVRRRHTFGYFELLRGGYQQGDYDTIRNLLSECTQEERQQLITEADNFQILWNKLWYKQLNHSPQTQKESKDYLTAKEKFDELRNDAHYQLLLQYEPCLWETPEWGFPKGKKNGNETDLNCAMRECFEETAIQANKYYVLQGFEPLIEQCVGTDHKVYETIYYVGYCFDRDMQVGLEENNIIQLREISKVEWFTVKNALNNIRPYNDERKQLLIALDRRIEENIDKFLINPLPMFPMLSTSTSSSSVSSTPLVDFNLDQIVL